MNDSMTSAPIAFRLWTNQARLHALVVERTKELDWVPELPPADSKALTFSNDCGPYALEWRVSTSVRFRFFLSLLDYRVHLVVQEFVSGKRHRHVALSTSLDDLGRRGMLTCVGIYGPSYASDCQHDA